MAKHARPWKRTKEAAKADSNGDPHNHEADEHQEADYTYKPDEDEVDEDQETDEDQEADDAYERDEEKLDEEDGDVEYSGMERDAAVSARE